MRTVLSTGRESYRSKDYLNLAHLFLTQYCMQVKIHSNCVFIESNEYNTQIILSEKNVDLYINRHKVLINQSCRSTGPDVTNRTRTQ